MLPMAVSVLLDRFHSLLAEQGSLCPANHFREWLELTNTAAGAAAGAVHALAPLCAAAAWRKHADSVGACVETLQQLCAAGQHGDAPSPATVTACERTLADAFRTVCACCELALL
jgi:hypothetical protein